MKPAVLLIDDEEKLRTLLKRIITLEGFEVTEAESLGAGMKILSTQETDIILCDVRLPDGNGIDTVQELKKLAPRAEIILLTAYGNIADGVKAMRNGAFDYITKGDDNDKIIPLLHKAFEKVQLARKVERLEELTASRFSFDKVLGTSAAIKTAIDLAGKVAKSDTTVLLTGETGTGKEVFAQAIHAAGSRKSKSFVAVNCSSFSRELLESELFGHKAGAFTGAVKDKRGLFEEANGGTLFLDEIGEMPVELQARLLRVLENGEFIKVGDTKTLTVNIRIIAATNRNLQEQIVAGLFRSDLYYRLSVFQLSLPPLRERISDIPDLATYFTRLFADKTNKTIPAIDPDYLEALRQYPWPGNIRELKNIIERSVILQEEGILVKHNLPSEFLSHRQESDTFDLGEIEKRHIHKVLQHTNGNKTAAAKLLGIGLTTLYRKVEEYRL